MKDLTVSSLLKPIEEEERAALQNKLNEQRLELEEKKRHLEELMNLNEKASEKKEAFSAEDLPDPEKMVQEFLESLEKGKYYKENEGGNENENLNQSQNQSEQLKSEHEADIYHCNHSDTNTFSVIGDKIIPKGNSLDDSIEQPSIFKNFTSAKPFSFKISKLNTAKVINIAPKKIKCFDKSIQVDLLPSSDSVVVKDTKVKGKETHLLKTGKHKDKKQKHEVRIDASGKRIHSPKTPALLKDKKKKKKKKKKQSREKKKKDAQQVLDVNGKVKEQTAEDREGEADGEAESEEESEEEREEGSEEEGEEGSEEGGEEDSEEEGEREGKGEEDVGDDVEEIKGGDEDETELDLEIDSKMKTKGVGTSTRGARETGKGNKKKCLKKKKVHKMLNDEQKQIILQNPNFLRFIENSSKLVERTLGEQDIFNNIFDFAANDLTEESESIEKLKVINTYYCKKYTNARPITDVRTSNVYSELFLASYGLSETATSIDSDGCVLVWNTSMNSRPEYVFTCQSAVCTALFNKLNPHIIIGGTYTGAVVLWDIRAKNKPVQKTFLSAQGHMHPIYCAEVVGTKNAHNLVTADTDGRLCKWSLNMLNAPSETIDLKRGNREVSCCCFSFQEGEINTLYGGAEDGSLFQAQIHGTKVGVTDFYSIHHGPITATQFHPLIEGTNDHNDIILTASVDWTCKLLSIRNPNKPLLTIDSFEDYLMDVKWNPSNPGVFASCTCNGNIKLWNISHDLQCPCFETSANGNSTNKVAWSHEGKKLIAADSMGYLTLWSASNDIYQPKSEEIDLCENVLTKLKMENEAVDPLDVEL